VIENIVNTGGIHHLPIHDFLLSGTY